MRHKQSLQLLISVQSNWMHTDQMPYRLWCCEKPAGNPVNDWRRDRFEIIIY